MTRRLHTYPIRYFFSMFHKNNYNIFASNISMQPSLPSSNYTRTSTMDVRKLHPATATTRPGPFPRKKNVCRVCNIDRKTSINLRKVLYLSSNEHSSRCHNLLCGIDSHFCQNSQQRSTRRPRDGGVFEHLFPGTGRIWVFLGECEARSEFPLTHARLAGISRSAVQGREASYLGIARLYTTGVALFEATAYFDHPTGV